MLAASEEVLGIDGELAKDAVRLAPAASKLQIGALRLVALKEDVESCFAAGTEWRSTKRSVWSLATVTQGPSGPKSRATSASPDVNGPWTSMTWSVVAR